MAQETAEATIGELSMVFQELENSLILLFARLTDPSHHTVGLIIASQFSFGKLLPTLAAVFRYRTKDPELIARMDGILRESHQLEQIRNTYIHSFYDLREITGDGVSYERIKNRIKKGKGFAPDYEMLNTGTLRENINRFRILLAGIDLFLEALHKKVLITLHDYEL